MLSNTDSQQHRLAPLVETRLEQQALTETREVARLRVPDLPPPSPIAASPGYEVPKYVLDFLIAAVLAVLFAPVVLIAAALVRLTTEGPAFYTQTRVGRRGREFTIYKLRTMYHRCEERSGARWAARNDPRVTFVGRFLRRTHLDELPQLLNVLRGDMSLVGPRPERPEFVSLLEAEIPGYADRLTVRPGVTGLAQIYLPPDTDTDSVRRKLVYDRYYIRHMGPWLDLRLMFCTALKMFGMPFLTTCRLLRVPGPVRIERAAAGPPAPPTLTLRPS